MNYSFRTTGVLEGRIIDNGIIPPFFIKANDLDEALKRYQRQVIHISGLVIRDKSLENKKPLLVRQENGDFKQTGFVFETIDSAGRSSYDLQVTIDGMENINFQSEKENFSKTLWANTPQYIEKLTTECIKTQSKGIPLCAVEQSVQFVNAQELGRLRQKAANTKTNRILFVTEGTCNGTPYTRIGSLDSLYNVFAERMENHKWFIDKNGDLRAEGYGTGMAVSCLFRETERSLTKTEIMELAKKLYNCSDTEKEELLNKYTRSLGHLF